MHVTSFGTETQAYFPVSLQPVFVGDEVAQASDFHAVVRDYDATNAFRALMGGQRRLCLNGLVGQEQHALVYARHTNGFSSQRAVTGILRAMERYLALDSEWKRWAGRPIGAEDAGRVFEEMPGSNPRRREVLSQAWAAEVAAAGPTVWALYNSLTRWSSHAAVRPSSVENRAAIVLERESLVRRTLATAAFQRLAA